MAVVFPIFGTYIPLHPIPDGTPIRAVALYGFASVATLIGMYLLIRKANRDKRRRKREHGKH